jgi:hypothetical protein
MLFLGPCRCNMSTKKLKRKLQMSKQNEQKEREKKYTVRPAGSKIRRSFSYTIITKSSCFDWLLLFAQFKMHYWWLVTWLDLTWQLHGFDEFRNNQGVIRNRSATIDKTVVSLCLSTLNLRFCFFSTSQSNRAYRKWDFFFWSFWWRSR